MLLSSLLTSLDAVPHGAAAASGIDVGRVVYDARKTQPGDMFVALPGTRVDGHTFLAQAAAAGAAAALVDARWASEHPEVQPLPCFAVASTRRAMARAAAELEGQPSRRLQLIGVTGTNGKTTTTHLIHGLFSALGRRTGAVGTLGAAFEGKHWATGFTTPQSPELQALLREMVDAGAGAVCMEASSHAIEQERIYACAFQTAVFTNLSQDHLDYHGTMDTYAAIKRRLFNAEATGSAPAFAVVNLDDPLGDSFASAATGQVIGYGLIPRETPWKSLLATDLHTSAAGCRFTATWGEESVTVRVALPGRFNVSNALAALGAGLAAGHSLGELAPLLAAIPGVPGRAEVVSPPEHPFTVWVDYAHTPDGLENILTAARELEPKRLLVVFGCGGDRDRTKRPLMGEAAGRLADLCFVTSDNPRSEAPRAIIADITPGIAGEHWVEPDREAAIATALSAARPGDLLVIAGKGHETTQTFHDRTVHFDDREVARRLLDAGGEAGRG